MKSFGQFLLSMGKVGCIGFGGGSALIPVIEKEIIDRQKLDTKANYDKDIIVASITPGALPVEIAASLGRRNFGNKGMILGAVFMAFPGAFATMCLLTLLSMVQTQVLNAIHIASVGVSAFIMFLLLHYIKNVLIYCKKDNIEHLKKAIGVILIVFFLVCGKNLYRILGIERDPIFGVSTVHILAVVFFCILFTRGEFGGKKGVISIIIGGIYLLGNGKAHIFHYEVFVHGIEILMLVLALWGLGKSIRGEGNLHNLDKAALGKDVMVWIVFLIVLVLPSVLLGEEGLAFAGKGILSAVMSFGGGDAYLTIAEGLFVETGMISEAIYYGQVVAIVNILPGSILCKTLSGVGYYIGISVSGSVWGGVLFGIAGFACSIAASCGFFSIVYHMYESLTSLTVFQMIARWIRPIIAGLLLNVILSLGNQSTGALNFLGISGITIWMGILGLVILDFVLEKYGKMRPISLLLLNLVIVGATCVIF